MYHAIFQVPKSR